ncbi:MAG: Hpt domain-containing protein [Desulfomonilaceae bacterium]|jgi:HPt (histidine-containing phosphotransfer) domain-containing protein|nr:Hpt domain-containing protein [Syntrophaceae bacterium]
MMITIEELTEELGIDREDVVEFISVFLDYTENEDLPALLEGINKRDAEVVRKRAHSIKGAALNLMLSEISSLAAQLEKNAAVGKIDDSLSIYTDILERMKVVRETLT